MARFSGVLLFFSFFCQTKGGGQEQFVPCVEGLFPGHDAQCGPLCLQAGLKVLGQDTSIVRLLEKASTDTKGTTIRGLAEAVKEQGLFSVGVRMPWDQLHRLLQTKEGRVVAICHLNSEHFVLLYWARDHQFCLLDPRNNVPKRYDLPEENEDYSGAALLVSEKPILLPAISASPLWFNYSAWSIFFLVIFLAGWLVGKAWCGCGPTFFRWSRKARLLDQTGYYKY